MPPLRRVLLVSTIAALLGCVLGASGRCYAITGHVVKVYDGDTITIETTGGETEKVRLADIDAPELKQPHGKEARKALEKLLELDAGAVTVRYQKRDKYGRLLGTVLVEDQSANEWQVNQGHAWAWRERGKPTSIKCAQEEADAKEEKRGLWAVEKPQAPWDYRKQIRAQQPKSLVLGKMPATRPSPK